MTWLWESWNYFSQSLTREVAWKPPRTQRHAVNSQLNRPQLVKIQGAFYLFKTDADSTRMTRCLLILLCFVNLELFFYWNCLKLQCFCLWFLFRLTLLYIWKAIVQLPLCRRYLGPCWEANRLIREPLNKKSWWVGCQFWSRSCLKKTPECVVIIRIEIQMNISRVNPYSCSGNPK